MVNDLFVFTPNKNAWNRSIFRATDLFSFYSSHFIIFNTQVTNIVHISMYSLLSTRLHTQINKRKNYDFSDFESITIVSQLESRVNKRYDKWGVTYLISVGYFLLWGLLIIGWKSWNIFLPQTRSTGTFHPDTPRHPLCSDLDNSFD